MESESKTTLKNIGINFGSMTGIISAFVGLYYANILAPLENIVWMEYDLCQIIFLVLIAIGVGVIIYPVLIQQKNLTAARSEIEQFLQETTGASKKQVEHFEQEMESDIKNKIKGVFSIVKAKISRSTSDNDITDIADIYEVTHPVEIRNQISVLSNTLIQTIKEEKRSNNVSAILPADNISSGKGAVMRLLPPVRPDLSDVEHYKDYRKRGMITVAVIIGIAVLVYIISILIQHL
ncbi:MAG: hypothetical protein GF364_13085 [Candidatus Lokiarchaeota archaeon]|nr:hypothetical protein [Candidatus Lokiarchaeota archaeon]